MMAANAIEVSRLARVAVPRGQPGVRSLRRGLAILRLVSTQGPMTVTEIVARLAMARATTYRILLTLVEEGLIERSMDAGQYRLAAGVRTLSVGLARRDALAEVAMPLLERACRELRWPLQLATNDGQRMQVRATSRGHSAVRLNDPEVGARIPLLRCAVGHAFLAHCDPVLRRDLLDAGLRDEDAGAARARPTAWSRELETIRQQGFAYLPASWALHGTDHASVAVPVLVDGEPQAAISVVFHQAAVPRVAAVSRFVSPLRTLAAGLAGRIAAGLGHEPGDWPGAA